METNETETKTATTPPFSVQHHAHVGPLLGILVIVVVLIFSGLYLWGAMLGKESGTREFTPRTLPNNEPETTRAVTDQDILKTMSPSNEIDALYADIESTNLDTLDSELDQIEAELRHVTQ
jgi:hypothetical protein